MTLQPVLPLLLLGAVAAAIVVARVAALRRLTAAGRTRTALLRWGGVTLAALLLLVAAARPVIGSDDQGIVRAAGDGDPNVFIVVDRSADMRVEDLAGDRERMAGARDDISALIDRYPDARFAVISFASRPSLDWPLSADTWSLRPVTSAMTPYASAADAVVQTNVGAAGASETQVPQRQFELPEGAVDGGAVLGYGSADGGPIPGTDVARSAIDEQALRGVADQIGVPYVPRDGTVPLAGVLQDQGTVIGPPPPVAAPAGRIELYWAPAIGAAILVLIELYLVLLEFRRTRLANADVVV
jgi:hypothetical protein